MLASVEGPGADIDVELSTDIEDDELNRVVLQLGRLVRTASLEFSLRVGALVIHHFYSGDTDAWRARGPKITSFRRLAAHPGLPMSPGALYRCVAIFELCDRLSAPTRWRNLGASHLRAVLSVDVATQERLLAAANAERWTVRILQSEVNRNKSARLTKKGGRRSQPPVVKMLRSIGRSLNERNDWANELDDAQVDEVCLVLDTACRRLEEIREAMRSKAQHGVISRPGEAMLESRMALPIH
jgi:hypothetical protein